MAGLASIDRDDRTAPPSEPPVDTPASLDELCTDARDLGTANGLIGPGSPTDAAQLDALAETIDRIATATADDALADLAARVRLLADAVAREQGGAALNTTRAIGDDVEQLFAASGPCAS